LAWYSAVVLAGFLRVCGRDVVVAGASLAYLMQQRFLRRKSPNAPRRNLPSLERLEHVSNSAAALMLGSFLLTPATFGLGHTYGQGADPAPRTESGTPASIESGL